MSKAERQVLLLELRRIQEEVPQVSVKLDLLAEGLAAAQARVDEIEKMLADGLVTRIPSADLGP